MNYDADTLRSVLTIYNSCFPNLRTDMSEFCSRLGLDDGTLLFFHRDGEKIAAFAAVRADGILLLCVDRQFRNKGFGSDLLNQAETMILRCGYNKSVLGSGGGKYLIQGVPMTENQSFFERRGYRASWVSVDMVLQLDGFNLRGLEGYPYNKGVLLQVYQDKKPKILKAVEKINPAWVEYYDSAGDIVVAEVQNEVAACAILLTATELPFAANFNGLTGGIGCLGTVPEFRRRGIGLSLAAYTTGILKERGYKHSYLGYTWLRDWYGKLGYIPFMEFWMGEKQLLD